MDVEDETEASSADSPSRCVHAASGSCRERRSSGRSFLRSSHPSCTDWDLKEGPEGKYAHVRLNFIFFFLEIVIYDFHFFSSFFLV